MTSPRFSRYLQFMAMTPTVRPVARDGGAALKRGDLYVVCREQEHVVTMAQLRRRCTDVTSDAACDACPRCGSEFQPQLFRNGAIKSVVQHHRDSVDAIIDVIQEFVNAADDDNDNATVELAVVDSTEAAT